MSNDDYVPPISKGISATVGALDSASGIGGVGKPIKIELLRSQKNDVFLAIKKAGLEPGDFQWSEGKSIHGSQTCSQLTHLPTNHYFIFDLDDKLDLNVVLSWQPRLLPYEDIMRERVLPYSLLWFGVLQIFDDWVSAVQHEHLYPDLWEVAQQEKKLINENIEALENSTFSDDERLRISKAITELREFLLLSEKHSESQIQFITARLQHLEEASTRLGRKD